MATRTFVLGASLAMVLLLAYLTIRVAVQDGVSFVIVLSLAILGFLAIGVFGALVFTPRPPDDDGGNR
jgi:hypothetical protein